MSEAGRNRNVGKGLKFCNGLTWADGIQERIDSDGNRRFFLERLEVQKLSFVKENRFDRTDPVMDLSELDQIEQKYKAREVSGSDIRNLLDDAEILRLRIRQAELTLRMALQELTLAGKSQRERAALAVLEGKK